MTSSIELDRMILEYLLRHGESTVSEISRGLNIERKTVEYHIRKLSERGIIRARVVKNMRKYHVNTELIDPKRELLTAVASSFFYILAIILIIHGYLIQAVLPLLIPATLSVILSWIQYAQKITTKIETLLQKAILPSSSRNNIRHKPKQVNNL